ncbi:porin [Caldimonas brevitalea]|uniref:Outer membrane protein (Porin) n=1 Tax=Caldimonas brevitalea TaxID=413882 RepID=A0A0G3BY50_9BURK|nr:porin [Caldimonas brevitalea]AKJ31470.1 outer membrane protein (porin) [Caldimonas brevitalea]
MKKSLLALAVLGAFAGAASAQSAVTIYGKIDLAVTKRNSGDSYLANGNWANDEVQLQEQAGSRLGFRGTEDLGGGLKANFQIEHRFSPDTGAANANFWQGMSWVGVSGAFGDVRLGRDYSPIFWTGIASDPWGYDTTASVGTAHTFAGLSGNVPARYPNSISYRTPSLGGLTIHAAIGLPEADDTEYTTGFNVQYKGGPLYAGFGFHRAPATDLLAPGALLGVMLPAGLVAFSADDAVTLWNLTASYDLSVVKLIGSFAQSNADPVAGDEIKMRNFTFAITAPIGVGELRGQISRLEGTSGIIDDTKVTKYGVGYHYPLSKRTKVYADVGSSRVTEPDLKRRTAWDIGLQHNF